MVMGRRSRMSFMAAAAGEGVGNAQWDVQILTRPQKQTEIAALHCQYYVMNWIIALPRKQGPG